MISLSLSGIKKEYDMEENFVCQVCVFILATNCHIYACFALKKIDKISKFLSSKNNNHLHRLKKHYNTNNLK